MGTAAVLASVLAALTVGAGSAKAGLLGCNYPTAEQSFAPWGDYSKYVPVPGGSFESPGGWTLSNGAKIVAENEPFHLGEPTDSRSLVLPPGSSALTPGVCLYVLSPTLRFVGSASDGSGVKITMYTRTLFGLVQLPSSGYVDLDAVWNPSSTQVFLVQNLLGLVNLAQANIYFRFTPVGGATVQMDDVLLDPYLNF